MDEISHYIDKWDILIAHPPCTYLSNAGARHLYKDHCLQADRVRLGILGRDLFMRFWWSNIAHICIENPVPSKVFALPEKTQIIQPYEYGHPYTKKTLTKTMEKQGADIRSIAKVQYTICMQAGIYIPDEFIEDVAVIVNAEGDL